MTNPNPVAPKTDTPHVETPDDEALANRFAGLDRVGLRRRLWHIERQLADNVYRRVDMESTLHAVRDERDREVARFAQALERSHATLAAERASLDHWKGIAKAWEDDADHANKLLEAERASRVQAEEALRAIPSHEAWDGPQCICNENAPGTFGYRHHWSWCKAVRAALSKPSVSPEQAEETK